MTTRSRTRLQGGFSLGNVLKFVKDNKLASTVLNAIPHPYAQTAGNVAGALGYGKKRRAKRKTTQQKAAGIIGDLANMIGIGKRRKRRTRVGAGKKRVVKL